MVSVAGEAGDRLSAIGIRATTLRKFDQTQAIVPNGDLISSVVNNWTLDDRRVRVDFTVGVAYGSDTRLVERLIGEAVTEHELVLEDPEPRIFFFGVRRLVAQLQGAGVRGGHQPNDLQALSDLHFTIDEEFRAHDIEIPFPQRDLHVRSIDSDVAFRHRPTGES